MTQSKTLLIKLVQNYLQSIFLSNLKIKIFDSHFHSCIGTLHEMFEEVEHALFELEDLNEILDLQNRKVNHKHQLALYKENKEVELNSIRGKLFWDA